MTNHEDFPHSEGSEGGYISEQKALDDLKQAETALTDARELEGRGLADVRKAEQELEEACRPVFVFYVGKEKFETHREELTGAEIKATVGDFPTGYGLELEGHRDEPNQLIRDDQKVRMDPCHALHFTAVPPATFGSVAP
jgi:hypothetical protein